MNDAIFRFHRSIIIIHTIIQSVENTSSSSDSSSEVPITSLKGAAFLRFLSAKTFDPACVHFNILHSLWTPTLALSHISLPL